MYVYICTRCREDQEQALQRAQSKAKELQKRMDEMVDRLRQAGEDAIKAQEKADAEVKAASTATAEAEEKVSDAM